MEVPGAGARGHAPGEPELQPQRDTDAARRLDSPSRALLTRFFSDLARE